MKKIANFAKILKKNIKKIVIFRLLWQLRLTFQKVHLCA